MGLKLRIVCIVLFGGLGELLLLGGNLCLSWELVSFFDYEREVE